MDKKKIVEETFSNIKKINMVFNEAIEKKQIIEPVNGFLEYIKINTSNPISIQIYEIDDPETIIYENVMLKPGMNFLPIRYQAIDYKHERINYSYCKWLIQKGLVFNIKTSQMTEISIEVRYG